MNKNQIILLKMALNKLFPFLQFYFEGVDTLSIEKTETSVIIRFQKPTNKVFDGLSIIDSRHGGVKIALLKGDDVTYDESCGYPNPEVSYSYDKYEVVFEVDKLIEYLYII